MALCDITRIRKRVISLLLANRLAPYTDAVQGNSRYSVLTEFSDTILEVDAMIVQARISTPGDPHRERFMTTFSPDLANGDLIPAHSGAHGDVDVKVGAAWAPARYAKSRAEVISLVEHPVIYPDCERWVFIEDSRIFHNGAAARVMSPTFTKTAVCQAPEEDELAEIAGALGMIPKDGAVTPEIHDKGAQFFTWYIETQIKGKNLILPEAEQIERQLAA